MKEEDPAGLLRKVSDRRYDIVAFTADENRRLPGGLWQKLSTGQRLNLRTPAFLARIVDGPPTRKHSADMEVSIDLMTFSIVCSEEARWDAHHSLR